ncbi:hypothetical protein DL96DRAFT_1220387 [Flagelloscypha sp. PMI_526]|nr:hypothetical protein DL96DRAFT_1220387 [Flagelloscypha sp. PMI_526]
MSKPIVNTGIWDVILDSNYSLLDAWIYLQLIPNIILLPLLVATFVFATNVRRHPTLINVCVTWILSGFFSLLLFFGNQHKIPADQVNPGLCIVQASLFQRPNRWSLAVLMMVFHLLNTLRLSGTPQTSRRTMLIMLVSPYALQCLFTVIALGMALHDPNRVNRARVQFYCSLGSIELSLFRIVLTLLLCAIILGMEARLAWLMFSRWRASRSAGLSLSLGLGLFVRVLLFGLFVFLGMIINFVPLIFPQSHIPDIYAATMGLVIFLIFGTQTVRQF